MLNDSINNYHLISETKKIQVYEKKDYFYILKFSIPYNYNSNLKDIIDQNNFFKLLYELNPDIIIEYNKNNNQKTFRFNSKKMDTLYKKDIILHFEDKIKKQNHNKYHISFIINENEYKYEENIIQNLFFEIIIDNNMEMNVYLQFKEDCEFMKKDVLILILKKILFRLKKYCTLE